ncbi:hypothetical protein QUF70_15730 [Desulfobacterales bacterium HSG17]|nr:hypothetical protein [Desulfobacterales bacterium HSG17]
MTEPNKECELYKACSFMQHEIKNSTIIKSFHEKYCTTNKETCSRYMIAYECGLRFIPEDLFPNEYDKALQIISQNT